MSASLDTTRWNPPATKWMRGLIAVAVSTILSMPGCEQPTTITVAVRHDDKVQPGQIYALGFRVSRQDVGVVAGVEQDALPTVVDDRGVAPVLLHGRRLAEGVIEDDDLRLRRIGAHCGGWRGRRCAPGESADQRGQRGCAARSQHFSA